MVQTILRQYFKHNFENYMVFPANGFQQTPVIVCEVNVYIGALTVYWLSKRFKGYVQFFILSEQGYLYKPRMNFKLYLNMVVL